MLTFAQVRSHGNQSDFSVRYGFAVCIYNGDFFSCLLRDLISDTFLEAPTNMRSLFMSVLTFTNVFADAIPQAFASLSVDPLLVWNYGITAAIASVAGIVFWFAVRDLDAEDKLNNIQGHIGASKSEV